jgi:hypothetical protein
MSGIMVAALNDDAWMVFLLTGYQDKFHLIQGLFQMAVTEMEPVWIFDDQYRYRSKQVRPDLTGRSPVAAVPSLGRENLLNKFKITWTTEVGFSALTGVDGKKFDLISFEDDVYSTWEEYRISFVITRL